MDQAKIQRIIDLGVDFDIKEILTKAWEMFKSRALFHVGYMVLVGAIQAGFTLYLPDYTFIYSILLAPPIVCGFYLVANRQSQNEHVEFQNYLEGFKYWWNLVSTNLISSIVIVLGVICFILPGIYLLIGYMFCLLFVIFGGFDFWTSMELSRRLVHTNWQKFFLFGLALLALNIVGFLLLMVGLLVTVPMTYLSVYILFEDLTIDAVEEPKVTVIHE
ncbi:hypothetical protein LV84_00727 [Algoriphagus ratkowskyi]|uniref:Uncharacterized protein n=1 Tax=Algoriphagus ratkowskyi TaxID=57028 RepID=A0A2W7RHS0_9BACT|nr:hypothetical protein [Algoriphagus ratkowskyi]PZX60448.1 hypothetical protein LV84_00727 [Algoriphagus ratkowskyi]TXD78255.1 hypothetical protein ESW18_09470 [Algoriphagus ratkowskyi]